jgi:hypothetical protein
VAKKKKSTVAQEVEKAAKLLQRLVRLKASDDNGYCQCVTCDKIDHYKNMQGGHFIPRGRTIFKLYEPNIQVQCPSCNLWGMKQAHYVLRYRQWMVDYYGERRVKAMERLAWRASPKFNREEVIQLSRDLKEQIKEQEWRVGEI